MKITSIAILATIVSCGQPEDHSTSQKNNVSITLSDTKHGSGGGGTRAIKFDSKPIKFQSAGSHYDAKEAYKLINPTTTGFTLDYDVTITRRPTSKPERCQGSIDIVYAAGPVTKVIAPDFTLGVMTEQLNADHRESLIKISEQDGTSNGG